MYLAYTSNGKSVRVGDKVQVSNKTDHGFEVVSIGKPNSKKPQGSVSIKTSASTQVTVHPRDIGAEWLA